MSIDYSDLAFPKPSDIREPAPAVRVYDGGREVCNLMTAEGKRIYRQRLTLAWTLQHGVCRICGKPLMLSEATPDHIKPRKMGGSERDDRQENIAAVHAVCNSQKGSKRNVY